MEEESINTRWEDERGNFQWVWISQVCVCHNGRLFMAEQGADCRADRSICTWVTPSPPMPSSHSVCPFDYSISCHSLPISFHDSFFMCVKLPYESINYKICDYFSLLSVVHCMCWIITSVSVHDSISHIQYSVYDTKWMCSTPDGIYTRTSLMEFIGLPILSGCLFSHPWLSIQGESLPISRWPLSIPSPLQVRFTDIDYSVYHDAAMAVVEGGSPYERWEGERRERERDGLIQGNISILSTPRMATHPQCYFRCLRYVNNHNLYCVPYTIWCMQQISGKLLFCSADILVGWLCLRLGDETRKRRGEAKDEWVKKALLTTICDTTRILMCYSN